MLEVLVTAITSLLQSQGAEESYLTVFLVKFTEQWQHSCTLIQINQITVTVTIIITITTTSIRPVDCSLFLTLPLRRYTPAPLLSGNLTPDDSAWTR